MQYIYQILQSTLRIEQHLKDKPHCNGCCRQTRHPARTTLPLRAVQALDAGETYSQAEAAEFLIKSEKQVYRYRVAGRLPAYLDENGHLRYHRPDLERLFKELWGYPKGGFKR